MIGLPCSKNRRPITSRICRSLGRQNTRGLDLDKPEAMKVAPRILLTDEERTVLNVWLHLQTSARLTLRARIVLLAADGQTNQEIACQLGASRKTVSLWRRRFLKGRLAGIERESPRSKRKSKVYEATARLILRKMKEQPANTTHWTTRSLAKELKISPSLVHRVWQDYGLNSSQN
jgi:transposase